MVARVDRRDRVQMLLDRRVGLGVAGPPGLAALNADQKGRHAQTLQGIHGGQD